MKILHIIPHQVYEPRHYYLGSTKDARGRTEYFQTRGLSYDELVVEQRSDKWLRDKLSQMDLSQYQVAIFELVLYPLSLRYLRENAPHLKLISRSINAELYHRIHTWWASVRSNHKLRDWLGRWGYQESEYRGLNGLKTNLKLFGWIPLRFWYDYICAHRSHYMLSIVPWETDHYWRYFTKNAVTLLYFLPAAYQETMPQVEKKLQCVCLMSTAETGFVLDAAHNFIKAVTALGDAAPEWNFYITGDRKKFKYPVPDRIQITGFLPSPLPILQESRVMALLSDFGFGFKTKIMDAIASQSYTLVTPKLYERLPSEIQPYCVSVDLSSPDAFLKALKQCEAPFPAGDPNELLRNQAFEVLDKLLLEKP